MPRDRRVEAYIEKAQPFAQPILAHIREVMHSVDPAIGEGIKWSVPAFLWKESQIANMAGFEAHATLNFWRREVAGAPATEGDAMGQFGRLTSVADLPPDAEIAAMARQAIALLEAGANVPRPPKHAKAEIAMPEDFAAALDAAGHRTRFDAMAPSHRHEYLEWITTAKQPATRTRRIRMASAQVGEGKSLNWKYQ
jgi:uncharacterized protein YdeI (YjbR/CyaY-like superfamily)